MYLLFWFFCLGIFGVLWLGLLSLFVVGKCRCSKFLTYIGAVPLIILSMFALWCVFSLVQGYIYTSSPSNVYEMTFGFKPTQDVTNIKSSLKGIGDNAETYLSFQASPQTIQRIVASGFKSASREKAKSQGLLLNNSDLPAWWKPSVIKTTRFYLASHRVGQFSTSEEELLCYEPQTQIAYYQYVGID